MFLVSTDYFYIATGFKIFNLEFPWNLKIPYVHLIHAFLWQLIYAYAFSDAKEKVEPDLCKLAIMIHVSDGYNLCKK